MDKKRTKRFQVLPNAYIYQRPESTMYWGYLKIDGIKYQKSLRTVSKSEAEVNLIDWKQELLTSPNSRPSLSPYSFKRCADDFLQGMESISKPVSSGSTLYQKKFSLVYSPTNKYGLVHTFKDQDIRSIKNQDVNRYIQKLIKADLTNNRISDFIECLQQIIKFKNELPNFDVKVTGGRQSQPRGFFNLGNYRKLKNATKTHLGRKLSVSETRKVTIDSDLYPLIVFLVGSMVRPTIKECFDIRKKDIQVKRTPKGINYLLLNISRKVRTNQQIPTLSSSYKAFKELDKRYKLKPNDFIFAPEIKNRKTAMRHFQNQFKCLLEEINLTHDHNGDKLTLYSLRHTGITMNVKKGDIPMIELSRLADTSLKMINDYYFPRTTEIDNKLINEFVR